MDGTRKAKIPKSYHSIILPTDAPPTADFSFEGATTLTTSSLSER
jgi:hypothetical protein